MTCGDFSSKYFKKFPSNISSKLFFELYSSQYFSSEYFSSEYFSSEYYSSEYYSSEYCSKRVGENIVFVNFLWSAAHVSHTTVTDFRPKLALGAPTWHLPRNFLALFPESIFHLFFQWQRATTSDMGEEVVRRSRTPSAFSAWTWSTTRCQ